MLGKFSRNFEPACFQKNSLIIVRSVEHVVNNYLAMFEGLLYHLASDLCQSLVRTWVKGI